MSEEIKGWIEYDDRWPGVKYYRCGSDLCGWNALKPCPAHPQAYDGDRPHNLHRETREWVKCPGCDGRGFNAGRNEYETETCNECGGTGEQTDRWVAPSQAEFEATKVRIAALETEVKRLTEDNLALTRKVILLRKRLTDHGIAPEPGVVRAARADAPRIGYAAGRYIWSYELNDWVTVTRVKNPYVYCVYRGTHRRLKRVDTTDAPPESAPELPREIEVTETDRRKKNVSLRHSDS